MIISKAATTAPSQIHGKISMKLLVRAIAITNLRALMGCRRVSRKIIFQSNIGTPPTYATPLSCIPTMSISKFPIHVSTMPAQTNLSRRSLPSLFCATMSLSANSSIKIITSPSPSRTIICGIIRARMQMELHQSQTAVTMNMMKFSKHTL